jgi:hypothetical protein
MSYNGSGTFQINTSGQPVVTGTVISSSAFNALTADLATGLSTAITKNGQTATTVRIPFAQGINSSLATDTTSGSTGSIYTAGGVGITKGLFVGGTATFSATPIFSALTASSAVATDASKNLISVTNTGTGSNVLATSPTLVTPALGTPSALVGTNITGTATSFNINGTVGATTPSTGAFTSITASTTGKVGTTLGVGNATPSGSGSGITFPATQSASTDANTLDDYEEGTWTPSLGGDTTYTFQTAKYTKIGRMVTVSMYLTTSNIGTGSTTTVSGLPFTCSTFGGDFAGVQEWGNLANSFTCLSGEIMQSTTTIRFIGLIGGTANITNQSGVTVFQSNSTVVLTGTYFV